MRMSSSDVMPVDPFHIPYLQTLPLNHSDIPAAGKLKWFKSLDYLRAKLVCFLNFDRETLEELEFIPDKFLIENPRIKGQKGKRQRKN